MERIIATVEFEPAIKKWLENHCHENDTTFSDYMNQILEIGRQVVEHERIPTEIPKTQKLLIQCSMESLLILKESLDPDQRKSITERSKIAIRKTLGFEEKFTDISECQPY